ncbi:zf-HC2 domain-containing protein [Nakamurella sp.]|uniref:zf-HC2 domain-containing protein n=1 Tax=Nakamurella sp. TaxID=1869182 RepID=UPI003783284F
MTAGPIDHLTLDAVVAYADGEMSMVSYQRAAAHIALCPQCDAEVRAQLTARSWLRAAHAPAMPTTLLDTLRSIPVALPSTGPDVHPAPDRVRSDRLAGPSPAHQRAVARSRRFRFLGAGALVAGLTVGALVGSEPPGDPDTRPDSPQVAHVSPANGPQIATAGWGNP